MTGNSENTETTTLLSTLLLFVISLAVCGVFFIVLLTFCMLKKKPKLKGNIPHLSGKGDSESESTYEEVRKVSTQMETNLVKNVAYGRALKLDVHKL